MSPRPLVAISSPRPLARGAVLTKPSPVLQFEPAAMGDHAREMIASVARPTPSAESAPIPVIQRIVRHTWVDPRELSRAAPAPSSPAHRFGTIVFAALVAAALGALAGVSMRAITPAAANEAPSAHLAR